MLGAGAEVGTMHPLQCVVDGVYEFRHSLE